MKASAGCCQTVVYSHVVVCFLGRPLRNFFFFLALQKLLALVCQFNLFTPQFSLTVLLFLSSLAKKNFTSGMLKSGEVSSGCFPSCSFVWFVSKKGKRNLALAACGKKINKVTPKHRLSSV